MPRVNRHPISAGARPTTRPSRWEVFSSAPHRLFLFAGAGQCLAVMLWWAVELFGRAAGGTPTPLGLAPTLAHTWLMLYGIFPFFILGFLFTVYPRWLGTAPVARPAYLRAFVLTGSGAVLFYPGLFAPAVVRWLALALTLAGWLSALLTLLAVWRQAPQRGTHEPWLNAALAAAAAGMTCFLVAAIGLEPRGFALAREIGLWGFLVPVVFLVSHRMIPFFSQSVLMHYLVHRPAWAPPLVVVCAALHALLELAGLPQWRFLADAPLAVAALHLSYRWQFRASFHARLLAMLHIAFLWLGLAMLLYTLQSLALLLSGADHFGRAPLHALGIGFFTGMVVAMGSRVTLGHSGHSLIADTLTWVVLLALNVVAALRLAAEFLPTHSVSLNLLAALAWLLVFVPWVRHYAPLYWRERADGQPG